MDSPTMGREDLQTKVLPELQQIAGTLGVTGHQRLKKSELIDAIMAKVPGDGHVASEDGASSGNGTEGRALTIPVVVSVEDEDLHRSHFVARSIDSSSRPFERYQRGFPNIRRVQKYVKSQAMTHGVPVIPNYSLDQALSALIDLVVERATAALQSGIGPIEGVEATNG